MLSLRALLVAALCLVTLVAFAPAADAAPPGGSCHVEEEYVTEAALTKDENGLPTVQPGSYSPIVCYY